MPEGDWFCATCSGGNPAGEPGSSARSSLSQPSAGAAAAAAVGDAAVRSDGAKNGATASGDVRSRAGKTAEIEGEGRSAAASSNAQPGPTISDNSKANILPSSKSQHTPDESCGNGGWDEAGESHQSETACRNKKMRKKTGSSRKARGDTTGKATEPRGLERVPIYLGPARSVAGGANGSSRIPVTSTAPVATRLPAGSAAEIDAEDLPRSSAVLDSCGSSSSSSEEPENSKLSCADQETMIVVKPDFVGGEAAGLRQPTSGSEVAPSTYPLAHAPCPPLASPARAPAPARALVRTPASVTPSSTSTGSSSLAARALSPEPIVYPDSVNALTTDDHQLGEKAYVKVEVGGVMETGNANEATEASWECRCCNRRNCGKDRKCRECGAARPMGGGARAARRDGKRSRVQRNQRTPPTHKPELNAPASSTTDEDVASGKNAGEGTAAPPSPWVCRACATYNKMNRVRCLTCLTKNQRNAVEGGKPEWWCCSSCSRFNNRCQDGNRCRFCKFGAPAEEQEEDEEEVISVGEEEGLSMVTPNGGSERIAVKLPPG